MLQTLLNTQLPEDNPLERTAPKSIGDHIARFPDRLSGEAEAISTAVETMQRSQDHPATGHAQNWARTSDVVAKAIGLAPATEVLAAKYDMESRGQDLIVAESPTTPEQPVIQAQTVDQTAEVFDLEAIRSRINSLHVPTTEQLSEAVRPFGFNEAA